MIQNKINNNHNIIIKKRIFMKIIIFNKKLLNFKLLKLIKCKCRLKKIIIMNKILNFLYIKINNNKNNNNNKKQRIIKNKYK